MSTISRAPCRLPPQELNSLEEKAQELDQKRTGSLQSIAYINERNRKRNVEEAEKAIMVSRRDEGSRKGQRSHGGKRGGSLRGWLEAG